MDETLLRSDKTFDKERFIKIYEEFQQRGILLTIASGNTYPKLDDYFTDMNHDDLYFVSDNGNYTVKYGEVIEKNIISHAEILKLTELLEEYTEVSVVFSDGSYTYAKYINPEWEAYVVDFSENLIWIDSYAEIEDKEIVHISCHSPQPLEEIKKIAEKMLENTSHLTVVTSGGGWFDFYNQNGGKGSGIKALQKKYNISPAETMVFGDSLNDASMGDYAKYSIVMSNGDVELKDIFKYEIGNNNEQAVFDVLDEFLESNSVDFMEKYKI